jgi:hypothetical protein
MALIAENRADLEVHGASAGAISDAERLMEALTFTTEPEIYVDDSDGGITLDWFSPSERTAFGLFFPGKGYVVGVRSPAHAKHPVWAKKVTDVEGIYSSLERVTDLTGAVWWQREGGYVDLST